MITDTRHLGYRRLTVDEAPQPSTPAAFAAHSTGFARTQLLGGRHGAIHTSTGLCDIEPGGKIDPHVHSYEESFYVLAGNPTLDVGGQSIELGPDRCGVLPVGTAHAWHNTGTEPVRFFEMQAPRAREDDDPAPPDTFFVPEDPGGAQLAAVDLRDPRNQNFFRLDRSQMDVDNLKLGSQVGEPQVSASMATALLAYSGIAVKMLVDERLGAALHTMFMVHYQPGGVAHPHDHPLEESYLILDGEVTAEAAGDRFRMGVGDFLWCGAGCVHAFYNETDTTVTWLETSSPQPPARNSYRFNRDWDYLAEREGVHAAEGSTQE
ncbi:MAG TPA: cupin domain-containing protein [Solirubrobacterales bacterium]